MGWKIVDAVETQKLQAVLGESLIKLWKKLDELVLQKFFKILLDSNKYKCG